VLKGRLKEIDNIDSRTTKWTEILKGVLAGNVFDWGMKLCRSRNDLSILSELYTPYTMF
jgi:hypothetical protein